MYGGETYIQMYGGETYIQMYGGETYKVMDEKDKEAGEMRVINKHTNVEKMLN